MTLTSTRDAYCSRDVDDGASLKDAGVVHQNVHVPGQSLPAIALNGNVQFLNLYLQAACCDVSFERLHLPIDFDGSDDLETLIRELQGCSITEARSRACDQNLLHVFSVFR